MLESGNTVLFQLRISALRLRRSFPDPPAPYFAIALTFKWCLCLCLLSVFGFDPIYITPPLTHGCAMPPLLLTLILSRFLSARLHMLALLIMRFKSLIWYIVVAPL